MQKYKYQANLSYAFRVKYLLHLYSYDMQTTKQGKLTKKQDFIISTYRIYSDNKTVKSTK